MKNIIKYWQRYLGIEHWKVTTIKISTTQVSDEHCATGLTFVGVVPDHAQLHAEIYHTRKMTAEDIIHELLHVKHPQWSEAQVNRRTEKILQCEYGKGSETDFLKLSYNKNIQQKI
jgi:gamma-glutamylcyclotransferase (GGCT)/AIG2-like uncharacterized protein YtfP